MNLRSAAVNLNNNKSDYFGILASSLCMIHCLATPIIFMVQACTASCCESGPLWWRMMDYLFLIISLAAIHYSAKTTSLEWMPKAMYITWGILAFLIINGSINIFNIPHFFMYIPALSLVGLHFYNQKYCKCLEEKCCSTS